MFTQRKARSGIILRLTRCSAIVERSRCRVRYSFHQSGRLEQGDNILWTL